MRKLNRRQYTLHKRISHTNKPMFSSAVETSQRVGHVLQEISARLLDHSTTACRYAVVMDVSIATGLAHIGTGLKPASG